MQEAAAVSLVAFKTRININNKQAGLFRQAVGTRRVAYNYGLAQWKCLYEAWKLDNTLPKPSAFYIDKLFNAEKQLIYDGEKQEIIQLM
jgi:putative transposase